MDEKIPTREDLKQRLHRVGLGKRTFIKWEGLEEVEYEALVALVPDGYQLVRLHLDPDPPYPLIKIELLRIG